jgi:PAS domain S-box-containing protein
MLRRLSAVLVKPWAALPQEQELRATVVSAVILINVAAFSGIGCLGVVIEPRASQLPPALLATAAFQLVLWLLARSGRYRLATAVLVMSIPLTVSAVTLRFPIQPAYWVGVHWLVIGVGLASLVFSPTTTLLFLAGYLPVPLLLARRFGIPLTDVIGVDFFLAAATGVILLQGWVVRRAERLASERHGQAEEQRSMRETAEQQLSSSREWLAITLRCIGDGVITADADGLVTSLNPVAESLTGWREMEATGRPLTDLLHLVELASEETVEVPVAHERRGSLPPPAVVARLRCKDGSTRVVGLVRTPLRGQRSPGGGSVTVLRDETERFALEQELRSAHELEAIGRLAGGVAHDFNNVLFAIQGTCELLLAEGELGPEIRRDIQTIQDASHHAGGLTRQLLAFGRRQVLALAPLCVNDTVENIFSMTHRLLGEHITIELVLDRDLCPVSADAIQLEQVLLNLLMNARDAMPEGGRLTVETREVALPSELEHTADALAPGRYVRLTVRDTGVGIDPSLLVRVFDPFFTTKLEGRGTGLGLATVYGIVKQHGGHVAVDSTLGRGTEFRVYLPVRSGLAAEPAPPETSDPLAGRGETLLLVEDEQAAREVGRRGLERVGYRVLTAADGQEALDLVVASGGQLDLVISDVVMPRMSGSKLRAELNRRYPNIPVILMSGHTGELAPEAELGGQFLFKPYTLARLTNTVRSALDRAPGQ